MIVFMLDEQLTLETNFHGFHVPLWDWFISGNKFPHCFWNIRKGSGDLPLGRLSDSMPVIIAMTLLDKHQINILSPPRHYSSITLSPAVDINIYLLQRRADLTLYNSIFTLHLGSN